MKILSFFSLKGGVGKTTAACLLARVWAAEGRRVLLVDLDPQGSAGFLFRLPVEAWEGKEDGEGWERHLRWGRKESDHPGLDVIPASPAYRRFDRLFRTIARPKGFLRKVLASSAPSFDVAILDCPAGLSILTRTVLFSSDLVAVPLVPNALGSESWKVLVEHFRKSDLPEERLAAFPSLVRSTKSHRKILAELRHSPHWVPHAVPHSSRVEEFAAQRMPAGRPVSKIPGVDSYRALAAALSARLGEGA